MTIWNWIDAWGLCLVDPPSLENWSLSVQHENVQWWSELTALQMLVKSLGSVSVGSGNGTMH